MKTVLKAVAVAAAVTVMTAAVSTNTYAGNQEWATAGKVLTGVAAAGLLAVLASHADHNPGVAHASYGAPPPPPQCEPPPPWIGGHYECRRDRVCLPAHWDTVVDPAQYGWVRAGCEWVYVMTKPECVRRV